MPFQPGGQTQQSMAAPRAGNAGRPSGTGNPMPAGQSGGSQVYPGGNQNFDFKTGDTGMMPFGGQQQPPQGPAMGAPSMGAPSMGSSPWEFSGFGDATGQYTQPGLPQFGQQPQPTPPTIGGMQIPGFGGQQQQPPGMGPGSGGYGSDPQNAQGQFNQMLPGWGGGMGQQQPGLPQFSQPPGMNLPGLGGWGGGMGGAQDYPNNPGGGGPHMDFTPGGGGMQQPQPLSVAPGSRVSQGITPAPGTYPGQDGQTNRVSGTGGPVAKGAAPGSNAYGWYR